MNAVFFGLIALAAGALCAFSQRQTVYQISPESPQLALFLVMGGAILRWVLLLLVFFLAFRQHFLSGVLALAGTGVGRWAVVIWESVRVEHE